MLLNVDQKRIIESNPNGHMLIKGVAGSGKTTVGIHKLPQLATYYCVDQDDKVLFVTYANTLVSYIKNIYEKMDAEQVNMFDMMNSDSSENSSRVEISTIDKVIYRLYKEVTKKFPVFLKPAEMREAFQKAIIAVKKLMPEEGLLDLKNLEFIRDEILWMKACGYHEWEIYREVNRLGRTSGDSDGPQKLRKDSDKRYAVYQVMSHYDEIIKSIGKLDFHSMSLMVCEAMKQGFKPSQRYTHLIIDEAQDLSKCQLDILVNLHRSKDYSSVIFVADTAQSIYSHSWLSYQSFKSIGYEMSGRTRILSKNYRTTVEIAMSAYSLIEGDSIVINNENYVIPDVIERHGEKPLLKCFEKPEEELQFIRSSVLDFSVQYQLKDICVIARTNSQLESLHQYLLTNGVEAEIIKQSKDSYDTNSVKLLTMHSIKGLEFPIVFIMGLNEGIMPYISKGVETSDLSISMERKLLYVGMTRAKDRLILSYHGIPSMFIEELNKETLTTDVLKPFEKPYRVPVERYKYADKIKDLYSKEEAVRQWVIEELVKRLKYPLNHIDIEMKVNVFSQSGYVDIVVFRNSNSLKVPYIFIEVKAPMEPIEHGLIQVQQYAQVNRSIKYVAVTNGREFEAYSISEGKLTPFELPVYSAFEKKRWLYEDIEHHRLFEIKFSTEDIAGMTLKNMNNNELVTIESLNPYPLCGKVSAGLMRYAFEDYDNHMELPSNLMNGSSNCFILEVDGDSMIDAGILPGNHVVVRRQNYCSNMDIVIANVEDEATMKQFSRFGDKIALMPKNRQYQPIMVEEEQVSINGVVIGILRD